METFSVDPADVAEAAYDLLHHARCLNPDLPPELLKVRVVCAISELVGADPNHICPVSLNTAEALHLIVDQVYDQETAR